MPTSRPACHIVGGHVARGLSVVACWGHYHLVTGVTHQEQQPQPTSSLPLSVASMSMGLLALAPGWGVTVSRDTPYRAASRETSGQRINKTTPLVLEWYSFNVWKTIWLTWHQPRDALIPHPLF